MLALNQIADALPTSEQPLIKQIYTYKGGKLIGIGLRGGVGLPEQLTLLQTKIIMVTGEIDLTTATHSYRLERFDTFDIPVNVTHTILGVYDAIFLLLVRKKLKA